MKWSPAKTQRMVFRPTKNTLRMFFGSDEIMPQKIIESLGVLIDRDCAPSSQIQRVCNSVKSMTSLVRKNVRHCPDYLIREIYNTYVLPKISYCSEQWHSGKEVNIRPIVREVKNFRKLSSSNKPLKDFLWPREQLIYNDLVLMNKIVHEKSVVDFDVFFKRCENNTRQNSVRKIENFKYHLDVAQNIFSYRVINYWNKLSYDTSQLTGSMFKATVKKVLKKEAVKFVNFGISFNVVTS
jgi:hypothetical protein